MENFIDIFTNIGYTTLIIYIFLMLLALLEEKVQGEVTIPPRYYIALSFGIIVEILIRI